MKRVILAMALLAAPGLGHAQGRAAQPTTPGPTSAPDTSNRNTATVPGLNGAATQTAPTASPVPATPPSSAPPDVMIKPK